MFSGVSYLSLDPKNRIAIPAKYRDCLRDEHDSHVVLTLESASCVVMYPKHVWDVVHSKVQSLPNSSHPLVKSYQRLILGYAESIKLDQSGRVLLPATLRELTSLDKDIVLVGLGNKFELWNRHNWDIETQRALGSSLEDLSGLLDGVSL